MFTGIITHLGKLETVDDSRLQFSADPSLCDNLFIGQSIAVNGTCLTAQSFTKSNFTVEVMPETMSRTMLGNLKPSDIVNLELPATPTTFLAGHIVQGHIDGIGILTDITPQGNSQLLDISVPERLIPYIVEKGSIALNGISLTVIHTEENILRVGIIPHTWEATMLHTAKIGDILNIEVDILAKYIEKLTKK